MIFLLILVHIQEARQFLHAFFLQCINKKKRILFCYKRLTIIHKRQILYNCYCTCLCMERQRTTMCSLQESLVILVFQKFIYNNWSGWCKALINHNARVDEKDEAFILVPMNSNQFWNVPLKEICAWTLKPIYYMYSFHRQIRNEPLNYYFPSGCND